MTRGSASLNVRGQGCPRVSLEAFDVPVLVRVTQRTVATRQPAGKRDVSIPVASSVGVQQVALLRQTAGITLDYLLLSSSSPFPIPLRG